MSDNTDFSLNIKIKRRKAKTKSQSSIKCQYSGCNYFATNRAPKGRYNKGEYWFFCLDHVRMYNRSYNYFSGLTDEQFSSLQDDISGNEKDGSPRVNFNRDTLGNMEDDFGLFKEVISTPKARRRRSSRELEALDILCLPEYCTLEQISTRYKELIKRHHPDTNMINNKEDSCRSEQRLRTVIEAYKILKTAGDI